MLAAGADALLGVAGAAQAAKLRVRGGGAEEYGLELVHPGVGEQERGVVDGYHGARRPWRVRLGLEEVDENLPDPGGRPIRRHLHRRADGGSGGGGDRRCSRRGEADGGGGGRQNPSVGLGDEEEAARCQGRVQHTEASVNERSG